MAAIPAIDDERLALLLETLVPVVEGEGGLWHIAPTDPRTTSFTWSPTLTGRARDLIAIESFPTFHSFSAPAFFKPTIAEVLSQLPGPPAPEVVAFTTLAHTAGIGGNGHHVATSVLYARRADPAGRPGSLATHLRARRRAD